MFISHRKNLCTKLFDRSARRRSCPFVSYYVHILYFIMYTRTILFFYESNVYFHLLLRYYILSKSTFLATQVMPIKYKKLYFLKQIQFVKFLFAKSYLTQKIPAQIKQLRILIVLLQCGMANFERSTFLKK